MAILEDFIEDDIISFEICHSNEIVCYDCEGYENNFSFFLFLLSFLFLCKISLWGVDIGTFSNTKCMVYLTSS